MRDIKDEEIKAYDLACPRCDTPLAFIQQVNDMIQMSEGEIGPPWFLNLWCEKCGDMTTSLYWEENGESEEVEVPAMRDVTGGIDRVMFNRPKTDSDNENK